MSTFGIYSASVATINNPEVPHPGSETEARTQNHGRKKLTSTLLHKPSLGPLLETRATQPDDRRDVDGLSGAVYLLGIVDYELNTKEKTFFPAVNEGDLKTVRLLLARGVYINTTGDDNATALHLAALGEHVKGVILMVGSGADIQASSDGGIAPLHIASALGNGERAKLLLDAGANTLPVTNHEVARKGHCAVLLLLLDRGVNIESVDKSSQIALQVVALNGLDKAITVLCHRKAM